MRNTLSPVEACCLSGLSPAYLYLMLRAGRIAGATKTYGGRWEINREAFEHQFARRIAERKAESVVEVTA